MIDVPAFTTRLPLFDLAWDVVAKCMKRTNTASFDLIGMDMHVGDFIRINHQRAKILAKVPAANGFRYTVEYQ